MRLNGEITRREREQETEAKRTSNITRKPENEKLERIKESSVWIVDMFDVRVRAHTETRRKIWIKPSRKHSAATTE